MIRAFVVLCVLGSPVLAQPGERTRDTPGSLPTIVILSKVDKERKTVAYSLTVEVSTPVFVRETVLQNGKPVERETVRHVSERRMMEVPIDLEKVKIFATSGQNRSPEQALAQLKAGDAVVLIGTKEMLDKRYLSVLREDALILAHPSRAVGGVGAPLPPMLVPAPPLPK